MKVESFTDLVAWQEAHRLALEIYKITKHFPREELYSLTDQIRRCVVSIGSNIAEGFARRSKKEKLQFYYTALGSLAELQNQLLLAKDIGYLEKAIFQGLAEQTVRTSKLINGLIKFLKNT